MVEAVCSLSLHLPALHYVSKGHILHNGKYDIGESDKVLSGLVHKTSHTIAYLSSIVLHTVTKYRGR
jgi:hypothetical protein